MVSGDYLSHVYSDSANSYDFKLASYIYDLLPEGNEDRKLLDIGCGKGHQLLAFARYFKVFGADIQADSVEYLEAQNIDYSFQLLDLEKGELPFQNNTFDVVFSKSVIEHIGNTDLFLQEAKRVLKPGGEIVILTPNWETQWKNFYDDYTHIKPFTPHGLKMALRNNGVAVRHFENFYQLPFLWKCPILKPLVKMISLLPDKFKWKNNERMKPRKLIRFSKETMILAIGTPGR